MDAYAVMLATQAAAAVISQMPTHNWRKTKTAVVHLFDRTSAGERAAITEELDEMREQLLRSGNSIGLKSGLLFECTRRFGQLLEADDAAADGLRQILDDISGESPDAPYALLHRATYGQHLDAESTVAVTGSFSQFIRGINRDG
ncbi:hypothetical protein SAMN05421812_102484 [Asanoa hainanensis]|uniref:Uncharacterized protein n=1 Tax=Asanoa hainanensis TaxID=560556 RepID=A0A239INK0_9ACTN|nr:hypothetical protein [Asanoa hainanensis]SNS95129.1 hypothetical protein SAMN05421812_102484 [Asanoa hainanensis]